MLDRAILAIAPAAGRRRIQERMRAEVLMNFDAASRGRRTYGWKAPASSADAALHGSVRQLRQLSRDFLRNRPYAVRAREVVVAHVVGTGVQFSVSHDDRAMREQIEAVLWQHLMTRALDTRGELDLPQLQAVAMRAVFSDGEVLIRRRSRKGTFGRGLMLPWQVEVVEADHLDDVVQAYNGNEVIDGIEYDQITGRIVAYHLYDQHPGSVSVSRKITSSRVLVADVIHLRRFDRPGQLRGVPWLAPVLMTMGELSEYQEAQILKQRMSALVAGVIEREEGVDNPKGDKTGLEALEPGVLVNAPPGTKINWTDPPSVEGYADFMAGGLRACAMGLGLSYESLSGDLSGVNFSSARMGRMEFDRNVEGWQQSLMVAQLGAGLERWIMESWPLQAQAQPGILPLPRPDFVMEWTPPRRPLIDPEGEVSAMITQIDAGLTSRQRVQRTLGFDPDVIREERVEDIEEDKAVNLPPPAPRPGAAARPASAKGTER